MSLSAGTRLGPYEIVGPLGAGGMGEVYRARDTRLARTVALKVLPDALSGDPTLRARLEREARAVSSLDHPHICALYDIGSEAGVDFLVMALLEGESLGARLARGPLPLEDAIEIGAQIASALAAAHRRGIVHRDLKPGNVMLTKSAAGASGAPHARLLDFGLAKQGESLAGDAQSRTMTMPLTAERTIVGTLYYMAPEQLEGADVGARTDIFALGLVLYEMVAGRRAFEGASSASLIAAILTAQPTPLMAAAPLAPPSLDRLVRRCLAKHPDDRWQSAADVAWELRHLHEHQPAAAGVKLPAPANRRRWIFGSAAAALILSMAGAYRAGLSGAPPAPDEVRLSMLPPDGHALDTSAAANDFDPQFAVSPDGDSIAFVAINSAGRSQLWVRRFGSGTARLLEGTDQATRPFWSPDGQYIGYASPTGLMKVPIEGGGPQTIAQSGGNIYRSNGTWGKSGMVMFDRGAAVSPGDLMMVPAAGGAPVSVPHGDAPAAAGQRYPTWLPDGRRFLFVSWASNPSERAIYLGSLDSPKRIFLVKSGFRAFYARGYLLYVRDRMLVAQRFSLESGALTGEPIPVVDGVALEQIPGQSMISVSSIGAIAYRSRTTDLATELRWFSRKGAAGSVLAAAGTDITVSLSATSGRALITRLLPHARADERLPANIWLVDLLRGVLTRATLDASQTDENPVWSPDGAEFAYAAHIGGGLAEVRVQSTADPGRVRVVASGPDNFHPIDWSSDGKHLLLQRYATAIGADDMDLWVLGMAGGGRPAPYLARPYVQGQGQFSPDGRWVAYMSDESGRPEVYVEPFPARGGRTQISADGGAQPRWRADGRELFYIGLNGEVMAAPVEIRAGSLSSGTPSMLFTERSLRISNSAFFYGGAANYDVTRDGQRLLINRLVREPSVGPLQIVLHALR
ncbi:MAG: protein kinase [Vicinamibacterales bacterium]